MEDLSVGSGSIIGNRNIEEFFTHISMHEEVEEKSWVELAPSIEVASVCLIDMLETRLSAKNLAVLKILHIFQVKSISEEAELGNMVILA
jgi:hypothetical protein